MAMTAVAQQQDEYLVIGKYRFKTKNNWVNFGSGPNFYPSYNFTNANLNIDYNFFREDKLYHIGYTNNSKNYFFGGGARTYLHIINGGIGKCLEKQYWKVAAFAGPSFVFTSYYPNDSTQTINKKKSFHVGLHLQPQLIFKPVYDFGLSICPFFNLNPIQSVFGVSICVYASNAMDKRKR